MDSLLSSSILKGSKPSFTPTNITCGHSKPLAACRVDKVTTLGSCSRSFKVDNSEIVWATSSNDFVSAITLTPDASSMVPPHRPDIQSTNSSTLVQRAAATFSLSSPSYKCFSYPMSLSHCNKNTLAASAPWVRFARYSKSFMKRPNSCKLPTARADSLAPKLFENKASNKLSLY